MTHRIEIAGSESTFTAEPDESVLDAGLRQGVLLPYGCRNGACGSCRGRVLDGSVEYPEGLPEALAPADADQGWALFCQARARSDLRLAVEEIDRTGVMRVRTLPTRVAAKERLAHDVVALRLALPPSERLAYRAGQYVDLLLRDGRRRAFSLANPPHDDEHLVLHIRQVPGGRFSGEMLEGLEERALLRLQGPLGSFYLRRDAERPVVLIGGGTGIAPIKSMIESALADADPPDMSLYWGVRSRRDLYLHDLALSWAASHDRLGYTPVLSEPRDGDAWPGRTGFVHAAVLEDFADLSGHDVYASGPPVMVDAARDSFVARGLPRERFFSDAFQHAWETGHDA